MEDEEGRRARRGWAKRAAALSPAWGGPAASPTRLLAALALLSLLAPAPADHELVAALVMRGLDESEMRKLFEMADVDGNGVLDVDEVALHPVPGLFVLRAHVCE